MNPEDLDNKRKRDNAEANACDMTEHEPEENDQARIRLAIDDTRNAVEVAYKLPWCVAQAINHDFGEKRNGTKRAVLFFLGQHVGSPFTLNEISEGIRSISRDAIASVLKETLVPLTAIPEYQAAYGFQIVSEERPGDEETGWQNRDIHTYRLELINDGEVPIRRRTRLVAQPHTQPIAPLSLEEHARTIRRVERETGIKIAEKIPDDSETLIWRASHLFPREKGYLEILLTLTEALRNGQKCSLWPFRIQFDLSEKQLGPKKMEEWSLKYAEELGFVIYSVDGSGYYTLCFLDEGERDAALEKKHPQEEDQYYHEVIPFHYPTFRKRLLTQLTEWRKKIGYLPNTQDVGDLKVWPPWLPSRLHYDFLLMVARAQKNADEGNGNYLTLEETQTWIHTNTPYKPALKTAWANTNKLIEELYEFGLERGFFIRKRITRPSTYEIVMLKKD